MRKLLWVIFTLLMCLAPAAALAEIPGSFSRPLKIVLITEFSSGSHASQYIEGLQQEAAALGFRLEILDARNNRERMALLLNSAVLQRVDGILISHGDPDSLNKGVERAIRAKIPMVAFDCEISQPSVVKLDQDDRQLAEIGLRQIIADIGGNARIVHIWVPGYAPMEKRLQSFWKIKAQYPGLTEVARFGRASANTALETRVEMAALLDRHPRGEIDAVWATWDEFAKGAAQAIMAAGRLEIKLYGIDVSDEDLALIQNPESPWVATAGVAPGDVGRVQVRILAHLIAQKPVPERYSMQPVLITRDMLPVDKRVTIKNLSQYVDGFGNATDFLTDWMLELERKSR